MEPHLGAGAGQAMEVRTIIRRTDANSSAAKDAFVLGRLLAHPLTTLSNVSTALKAYQVVRLPFAQFVARESERNGCLMSLDAHGKRNCGKRQFAQRAPVNDALLYMFLPNPL
jgi:salicylate hydroxylase